MSYHELNVEKVGIGSVQSVFSGADALQCFGVIIGNHIRSLSRVTRGVDGLVHDLEHTNIPIIRSSVNAVRHPLKEFYRALVVLGCIEPGIINTLSIVSYCDNHQDGSV